jgi:hypothetical protein
MKEVDYKTEFRELTSKNSIIISLIVIILGLTLLYYFEFFTKPIECKDVACYKEYLLTCKKSFLINEDENYVYRYEILKENGNSYCDVDVVLIKIKNGSSEGEKLESLNMLCKINRFEDILPEKNMLSCTGKLREELQEIIINKLHSVIFQNLNKINEKL